MEQWDEIQRTRSDFEDSNSFPTGEEDPCQAKICCWDCENNCTHLYFFPSTLAAWLLEVSERDVSVPPIIDRVVEDIVKGGKVCRGGEGGASVVVAWCLSPNSRPHLRLKWLTSRDIGTTEVIWSASTAWLTTDNLFEPNKHLPFYWQSRHIYHSQLSGPPWSPGWLFQGCWQATKSTWTCSRPPTPPPLRSLRGIWLTVIG